MNRVRLSSAALGLLLAAGTAGLADAGETTPAPETVRWSSSVGEVVFAHRRHTEEFGADCVSCHHETVAANLAVPHPDYFDGFWVDCKGCHTGGLTPEVASKCAACHPERVSGLNQEMPTAKVAIHRSCWGCHDRGSGSEASKQCGFCHQRPAAAPTAQAAPAGATATK